MESIPHLSNGGGFYCRFILSSVKIKVILLKRGVIKIKLLLSFKHKKINIFFSTTSGLEPLYSVTLKNISSDFFNVESDTNTLNKIYSISSIVSIEEIKEPEPSFGPNFVKYSDDDDPSFL